MDGEGATLPSRGKGLVESSMPTTKPTHAPPPSGGVNLLPPPPAGSGNPEEERALKVSATRRGSAFMVLPEDVLADILRRLPPRGLAFSRCVCRAWRPAVDGRRLLLLPSSVRGLLLGYHDLHHPAFLRRPSAGPDIDIMAGAVRSLNPSWRSFFTVLDHCNGLLLSQDWDGLLVSNPATRRWPHLPPLPRFRAFQRLRPGDARLVFDPADSPHYEVLHFPERHDLEEMDDELSHLLWVAQPHQTWPPSTWILFVFSSLTGRWEERSFAREGEPRR